MILSFKEQFKAPILAGTKIHTIREDAHDRWKKGMMIQMATGVRTKNYNCFMEGQCTDTQRIQIVRKRRSRPSDFIIYVDGKELHIEQRLILAKNDGFCLPNGEPSLINFGLWFNKDFDGKIIHWTDFKY